MSCSPFDLRDYLLGELAEVERRQLEIHLRTCGGCQEEIERLRATQATLLELRDEEVPQRIGFVSDPVFEPSAARRFWQSFWASGPKLGFASAAMLSGALLVFAVARPSTIASTSPVNTAQIERQVSERLAVEIEKTTAEIEAREAKKTAELVAAAEKRLEQRHESDMKTLRAAYDYAQKQYNMMLRASYEPGGLR